MPVQFVFPSSELRPTRVDEHFAPQHAAVADDHPVLLADLATTGVPRLRGEADGGPTVLRGWILDARGYTRLFAALQGSGSSLLTGPQDYLRGQWLRHWYADFRALTPASRWLLPEAGDDVLVAAAEAIGADAFVVRDAAKSAKHAWTSACFAPSAADVPRVVAGLRAETGTITDTIVVREFEDWRPGESRLWWVRGSLALQTGHPDTPGLHLDLTPAEVDAVGEAVGRLGCPFVATDVVRHADGRLRVVEVGDGQVCDFPMAEGTFERLVAALDG